MKLRLIRSAAWALIPVYLGGCGSNDVAEVVPPASVARTAVREPHAFSPETTILRFGNNAGASTNTPSVAVATSDALQGSPTTQTASSLSFVVEQQPSELGVWRGTEKLFELLDGHLARFRASADNHHWIGTEIVPVDLCWSADLNPQCDVDGVEWSTYDDGFDVFMTAFKPTLAHGRVQTVVEARQGLLGLSYTIRSSLDFRDTTNPTLAPWSIETLDLWFAGIFWPDRDQHDDELYSHFVYGDADGKLVSTAKLHAFPAWRDAAYEALQRPMEAGSSLTLLDEAEPGYTIRLTQASSGAAVGVCWWTWDPHWFLRIDSATRVVSYEAVVEPIAPNQERELLAAATPIDISASAEYAVPVFDWQQTNDFSTPVTYGGQWGFEPHSRACKLDHQIGRNDDHSATIALDEPGRTAWYTRALGFNYFDHEPLRGWYRVEGWVRTLNLLGAARIGVVASPGKETWLYMEPSPTWWYSESVGQTAEWSHLSVDFEAVDDRSLKIVLEQDGAGQSWFDDVSIHPLN